VARAQQGKLREAIDEFRRALAIDPGLVEARQFLDRALSMDKERAPPPR